MSLLTPAAELNPASLPLYGRHLIEASAGTGKTYNITRLYLRLLLEKKLPVQQILVMTFTKAATEELRGRIDSELRHALSNWDQLADKDPFFAEMQSRFSQQQAQQYLLPALLELDEAAIFTIHGFCNRALRQQAFASGMPLEVTMEADTSELMIEAVRDWIRQINQDQQAFTLLQEKGWHLPDSFIGKFRQAIYSHATLLSDATPEQIAQAEKDYNQAYRAVLTLREDVQHMAATMQQQVGDGLANSKQALVHNWPQLLSWLARDELTPCPANVSKFKSKSNYSAAGKRQCGAFIDTLAQLIGDIKAVLQQAEALRQSQRLTLVGEGIQQIQQKFAQAKQNQALLDFDDLIHTLSQAVTAEPEGKLVQALRQQYPVALVDEFQDTDPQQYGILDCLYPKGDKQQALLMIGDPKQAIYAFRGGDIFTYLSARKDADYHWLMHTNYRSVAAMVTAYNRLFWGSPLQADKQDVFGFDIHYEQIQATDKAAAASLPLVDSDPQFKAMNYLWLEQVAQPSGKKGATSEDYLQALARLCVSEIQRLLSQVKLGTEAIKPQDIAILVRRGYEAQLMQEALRRVDLASVYLSAKDNVFASEEAEELLLVLNGILHSERQEPMIAALSTRLMGGDATKLAALQQADNESAWERSRQWLLTLAQCWQQQGCMAMLLQLIHYHFNPAPERHERALTNMLHLAELLQQASRQYQQPQQLLKWFRDQCQQLSAQEQAQLRLESDANLIRIVTMHGSKGLEYPVVFVPFSSHYRDPARFKRSLLDHYQYHNEQQQLVQQIGHSDKAVAAVTREGQAESIRLLYVAVTRATHRCYLGVAPFEHSQLSPLGLTLQLAAADLWSPQLTALVASEPQSSALHLLADVKLHKPPRAEDRDNGPALQAASFSGEIKDNWSLSSFSALARQIQRRGPEQGQQRQDKKQRLDKADAAWLASSKDATDSGLAEVAPDALRFSLRKGADAGNLLHDILEHTDFSQPNWPVSLQGPVSRFPGLSEAQQDELAHWLQQCLDAPLPLLHGNKHEQASFSLGQLPRAQTLRESEFYFPIELVALEDIGRCLQQHRQSEQPIQLPASRELRGMMHGFIDLIFEYQGRYYIADYKSTHLGERIEDYHFAALEANNQAHYYDLQYLIYSVALHRFLQLRLPDYQIEQHFGGVYYLYLRGMLAQPSSQSYPGVYYRAIDPAVLLSLEQAMVSAASTTPQQGVA